MQRPQDGTKLVTFENLKMTKVARILGMGGGVEKGERHEMRLERWQEPHCAKLWVYPILLKGLHHLSIQSTFPDYLYIAYQIIISSYISVFPTTL